MQKKPMSRESSTGTGERRKYVRYACKIELKAIIDFNPAGEDKNVIKSQEIQFSKGEMGSILNISERGMAVELEHILPRGLLLKVAIENPTTPPIETDARVAWSDRLVSKPDGYIIGMQFRHMKEKHQRNLQRLIEFLQSIPD